MPVEKRPSNQPNVIKTTRFSKVAPPFSGIAGRFKGSSHTPSKKNTVPKIHGIDPGLMKKAGGI